LRYHVRRLAEAGEQNGGCRDYRFATTAQHRPGAAFSNVVKALRILRDIDSEFICSGSV
jgi:hypothetical protein